MEESDPGRLDIFGRLSPSPAFDIIVINKLASVTGCSTAELHSRGSYVCSSCHDRLLKLHTMETSVEQERAVLSDLYRRSSASRSAPSAAPESTAPGRPPPPPSGASLLLVNDVEVRLQDDQVTAVPITNTRRKQLLRQARSAEKRFPCKVCSREFRAFSHRVEHMLIHLDETPWACELCPKKFRTKSARTAHHQRVHTPAEGRFSCSVCDRQLSDAASLRAHARTHEPEKPYTCDTCHHKFARRKDYAVHVRQHTGERPHTCAVCLQTFVSRSRLNRHQLLHRDKQFACGCGRAFRRRYELQRHTKSCGQPAPAVASEEGATLETAEVTDLAAAAAGQVAGQATTLAYLPLVLPEAASTLYYQVVTPMATAAAAAPLPAAEGAEEAAVHQAAPVDQPAQLPVVTY